MKSKNNKLKSLLFILFFMVSMASMTNFISNIKADTYIPEENEYNGWHWALSEGDQIYFEAEFILTNYTTSEIELMFRDIWIYNITAIGNVTTDWLGVHSFSQINATQCYYNITSGELEAYDIPSEFALFGYNNSDPITHRYRAGQMGMALVLPLNSSNIEVDILDDIINETMYYPASQMGVFNQFDHYESDPYQNRILFTNSTDGYFSEAYYYDNGTLRSGSAFLMAQFGTGPMLINATFTQVFDYNITDQVEWGVNVGDNLYFDWYEGYDWGGDADDYRMNIVDISEEILEKSKNTFSDNLIYMTYQVVYADIYAWNGANYILVESNYEIGFANNFYPLYFDELNFEAGFYAFLYPNNFAMEDYEFTLNNNTLDISEFIVDEISYSQNTFFETFIRNSTNNDFVKIAFDKSTGIIQSNLMIFDDYISFIELKQQSLVDWSVNVGDVLYYKQNSDYVVDQRVNITGTFTLFVNLTELYNQFSSMGMPLTFPTSQPELQFYSYVEANFEEWDPTTESWHYTGNYPLAIANIYWPISPMQFEFGPPLLMPENTDSSELLELFSVYSAVYDEITYGPGYVILKNSTLDRSLYYYFDGASGRATMIYGWTTQPIPGSEWSYMSIYPKFYRTCPAGSNLFQLQSYFPMDITVNLAFNVTPLSPDVEYIYSMLPYNPINETLPEGTALVYFDQLTTNYIYIDGNLSMTITLPSSIDLSSITLYFFAWNITGTEEWIQPPPEFYDSIIYDYSSNSFTIQTPSWGSSSIISAISYTGGEAIPGYNPIFLLIGMIGISSIFLIKRKRSK
ncbi:MAG: Loki-CTERM sorting domain-containing protein [Candidatus Thorarchaeota archaeon]